MRNVPEEKNLKRLSEELVSDPRSLVFSSLADAYREKGMVKEAIEMCLFGISLHPINVHGHLVLGKCYLSQGKTDEARKTLMRVLELDPTNEEGKRLLDELPQMLDGVVPLSSTVEGLENVDKGKLFSTSQEEIDIIPWGDVASTSLEEVTVKEPVLESIQEVKETALESIQEFEEEKTLEKVEEVPQTLPEVFLREKESLLTLETVKLEPEISAKIEVPKQEELHAELLKIVEDIVSIEETTGGFIVSRQGLVLAEKMKIVQNTEETAALVSLVFNTALKSIEKMRLGILERGVIETTEGRIYLTGVRDLIVALLTKDGSKMGLIMAKMKKAVETIERIM